MIGEVLPSLSPSKEGNSLSVVRKQIKALVISWVLGEKPPGEKPPV